LFALWSCNHRKQTASELIPKSVAKYEEIVAEHVAAFGAAFTPPTTPMLPLSSL
jgi:hypothetical protein